MIKDVTFGELLNARFCHDIAGPIGAMNNGIDFLSSHNEEMKKKAIGLMQFSSKQAIARVAFFRNAYGFIAPHTEAHLALINELIKNFFEGTHINVNIVDDGKNYIIDNKVGKLLLNILIIAAAVIMHNGSVNIVVTNHNTPYPTIEVGGISSIYKVDVELINILKGNSVAEMNTRNVQQFYTHHIARNVDYSINITQDTDGVIFHMATVNSYA